MNSPYGSVIPAAARHPNAPLANGGRGATQPGPSSRGPPSCSYGRFERNNARGPWACSGMRRQALFVPTVRDHSRQGQTVARPRIIAASPEPLFDYCGAFKCGGELSEPPGRGVSASFAPVDASSGPRVKALSRQVSSGNEEHDLGTGSESTRLAGLSVGRSCHG